VARKPVITGQLYECDFALWLDEQAQALKEHRAAALDWNNLAEEIEGLVRSDRRALKSYLENALLHMLELAYWDTERERNQRQWRLHLKNARRGMAVLLEDSPSLARYLADIFDRSYQAARGDAEILIEGELPQNCEWTLEQVRNDDFYPSASSRSH
jgi:uncharacterized protein DUF29